MTLLFIALTRMQLEWVTKIRPFVKTQDFNLLQSAFKAYILTTTNCTFVMISILNYTLLTEPGSYINTKNVTVSNFTGRLK